MTIKMLNCWVKWTHPAKLKSLQIIAQLFFNIFSHLINSSLHTTIAPNNFSDICSWFMEHSGYYFFTAGKIKSYSPIPCFSNQQWVTVWSSKSVIVLLRSWWKKFWFSWLNFVLLFHVSKIGHVFDFLIRMYFIKMILKTRRLHRFIWKCLQIRHNGDDRFVGFFL